MQPRLFFIGYGPSAAVSRKTSIEIGSSATHHLYDGNNEQGRSNPSRASNFGYSADQIEYYRMSSPAGDFLPGLILFSASNFQISVELKPARSTSEKVDPMTQPEGILINSPPYGGGQKISIGN